MIKTTIQKKKADIGALKVHDVGHYYEKFNQRRAQKCAWHGVHCLTGLARTQWCWQVRHLTRSPVCVLSDGIGVEAGVFVVPVGVVLVLVLALTCLG